MRRPMGRAMVYVLVALLCGRDGALLAPRPVRAPMRLRAAADVAALEAASLEALGWCAQCWACCVITTQAFT